MYARALGKLENDDGNFSLFLWLFIAMKTKLKKDKISLVAAQYPSKFRSRSSLKQRLVSSRNHPHWMVYNTELVAWTLSSLLSRLQRLKERRNPPVRITLAKLLFALCERVHLSKLLVTSYHGGTKACHFLSMEKNNDREMTREAVCPLSKDNPLCLHPFLCGLKEL